MPNQPPTVSSTIIANLTEDCGLPVTGTAGYDLLNGGVGAGRCSALAGRIACRVGQAMTP